MTTMKYRELVTDNVIWNSKMCIVNTVTVYKLRKDWRLYIHSFIRTLQNRWRVTFWTNENFSSHRMWFAAAEEKQQIMCRRASKYIYQRRRRKWDETNTNQMAYLHKFVTHQWRCTSNCNAQFWNLCVFGSFKFISLSFGSRNSHRRATMRVCVSVCVKPHTWQHVSRRLVSNRMLVFISKQSVCVWELWISNSLKLTLISSKESMMRTNFERINGDDRRSIHKCWPALGGFRTKRIRWFSKIENGRERQNAFSHFILSRIRSVNSPAINANYKVWRHRI